MSNNSSLLTPHSSRLRIFVAGHNGMVGSAIVRQLKKQPEVELVTRDRSRLELTDQKLVQEFFQNEKIHQVYMASAKVGGIHSNNTYPAEFIYQNLMVECNIIHAAHLAGVDRILFLGSSCIYPRLARQPITEDQLMQGALELTNEPYAIAKIAGIKLCESYNRQYGRDYRSVMPTNLYGENDNFHPENAHVIPALIRRLHEAKTLDQEQLVVWGSGEPKREFLHVDDMAEACVFVMSLSREAYAGYTRPRLSHVNIGTGQDITIRELAETIADVVGFTGKLVFDTSKPDGPPRKLLNVDLINRIGWHHRIDLKQGLQSTYRWFLEHQGSFRE